MPYRLKGRKVQVKKSGKWKTLKQHKTKEKAQKHLAALKANTKH